MSTTQKCYTYAGLLTEKRVLYIPSCVIVEMMTSLYSEIFSITLAGDLHNVVPNLLARMRRLQRNLKATAEAYGQGGEEGAKLFPGDWHEDKLRARRVFFNIMSHLGYITRMVRHADRELLYEAVEGLTADWIALDRVMDEKSKKRNCGCSFCKYFRNSTSETWKQAMANVILTLDEDADYSGTEHLILICFERTRRLLLGAIDVIERRQGTPGRFKPNRILAVSEEDVVFSCPTCLELTDSLGTQVVDDEYPDSSYAENILRMKGAFCPMRPRPKRFRRADLLPDGTLQQPKPQKYTTLQRLKAALWGEPTETR